MGIIVTLLVGLIAGALAKLVMPGKDPGGILITMLIGIAGSLLAGLIGHSLGWYKTGEGPGIFGAAVGAFLLLALYRAFLGRRKTVIG